MKKSGLDAINMFTIIYIFISGAIPYYTPIHKYIIIIDLIDGFIK